MAEPKAKGQQDGENDLAILNPARTASVGVGVEAEMIIMDELSLDQSMEFARDITILCDALCDVASGCELHDLDSLRPVFADHRPSLYRLMAASSGRTPEWFQDKARSAMDGERLLLAWWGANGDFFLTRVLVGVQLRRVRLLDAHPAGQTSSPSSSMQGTTHASSEATPAGS